MNRAAVSGRVPVAGRQAKSGRVAVSGRAAVSPLITSFLLDAEFLQARGAPMDSPQEAVPGPGLLNLTDASAKYTVGSNGLQWTTRTVDESDPRAIFSATLARANGRAVHSYLNDTKIHVGWDTANNRTPSVGAFLFSSTAVIFQVTAALQVDLGDIRVHQNYYNFAVVLQDDGAYFFIKTPDGSDYPFWELLYFSRADASANLYCGVGPGNGNPSVGAHVRCLRATDLSGGFETAYGTATSYAATAAAGATGVMSPNGQVQLRRQFSTGDTFEVWVRYTDDQNGIKIKCDQAGSTIKVIEVKAGVETQLSTASQTWNNGTTYEIGIRCKDYSITPIVADVPKTGTVAATFNALATGMKVSHAVTKWAAWPRLPAATPAAWLDAIAKQYAGTPQALGSGTHPASDYSARVAVLSPAPIAYWPLQEPYGTTVLDATGNARGAVSQGAHPGKNGLYGTSYLFDGLPTSNIQANAALRAAFSIDECWIGCWIYVPSAASYPAAARVINCYGGVADAASEYFACEIRTGNEIGLFLRDTAGNDQSVAYGSMGGVIQYDRWFHLVMFNSLSAGKTGVYRDGVLYEVAKTTGTCSNPNSAPYPQVHDLQGYAQHYIFGTGKPSQSLVNTICT